MNLQNADGRTALHEAVVEQDLDRTMLLLIHGADPNIADNQYIYPLHLAALVCCNNYNKIGLFHAEAAVDVIDQSG